MQFATDCAMVSGVFDQPTYLIAQRQMDWALAQQSANAANLANQNVPGYKRVEAQRNFESTLDNMVKKSDLEGLKNASVKVERDTATIATRPDGNNVSMEKELSQMHSTSVAQEFAIECINHSFELMRLSITGRKHS